MSLKTWTKRFADYYDGAPISKSIINALCSVFRDTRGRFPEEVHTKVETVACYPMGRGWTVTPEQTVQGLGWSHRREIRRTLSESNKAITDDFDRFTFRGVFVEDCTTNPSFPTFQARPVYRAHSTSGKWFDYTPAPWQSGMEPILVLDLGTDPTEKK